MNFWEILYFISIRQSEAKISLIALQGVDAMKNIDLSIYRDMYIPNENGEIYSKYTNRILKPFTRKDGYQVVSLVDPNTREKTTINVHRYVGYCLLDGYEEGLVINHKDGNRSNNAVSNLEWITQRENIEHATEVLGTRNFNGDKHPMFNKNHTQESKDKMSKTRRERDYTGSRHPRSKPVVVLNYETGEYVGEYESMHIAAKELGLSQGNMYMVCTGKRKYTKGYKIIFKEDYKK